MGLDMYLYATDRTLAKKYSDPVEEIAEHIADGWWPKPTPGSDPYDEHYKEEIFYWRKHRHLMGLIEEIYLEQFEKRKDAPSFNCIFLRLDKPDIDRIRDAIIHQNWKGRSGGFFWGEGRAEHRLEEDLKALKAIDEARSNFKTIFFYASW